MREYNSWMGWPKKKDFPVQLMGWPIHDMQYKGTTNGWASATNEAEWHTSLDGLSIASQRNEVSQHNSHMGWPVHDMDGDGAHAGTSHGYWNSFHDFLPVENGCHANLVWKHTAQTGGSMAELPQGICMGGIENGCHANPVWKHTAQTGGSMAELLWGLWMGRIGAYE
ncbi:hypothetical protein EDD16DRAFT_1525557 [Pisolithus croceorrhizus]|nr:hypothetical protein EDD16DRAFT_1525557 [Pisolithus croceorrhizus]